MTILWSIVPSEVLYQGFGAQKDGDIQEITVGHATMMVTPAGHGMARIERLISPWPRDYLRPDWQPGSLIPYPAIHSEI